MTRSSRRRSRDGEEARIGRAVALAALAFGLLAGVPALASGPVVGWGAGGLLPITGERTSSTQRGD